MMQHLDGWISKPEGQLVLRYRWLGAQVQQAEVTDNRCEIAIPTYSFNRNAPREEMTLRIELMEVDEDGFTSDTPTGMTQSGGGSPAVAVPSEAVRGADSTPFDLETAESRPELAEFETEGS